MARAYKRLCISVYDEDLKNLDRLVDQMKSQGYKRANRSRLIRFAVSRMSVEAFAADVGKSKR